jgi:hypothetical protein
MITRISIALELLGRQGQRGEWQIWNWEVAHFDVRAHVVRYTASIRNRRRGVKVFDIHLTTDQRLG